MSQAREFQSVSDHFHPHSRPSTPDKNDSDHIHPTLPPSPDSVSSNEFPPEPRSPGEATPSSPPIKLLQKTWARSRTLEVRKVRLKNPTGVHEAASVGSKWAGTMRKVADVYTYTRIQHDHVRLLVIKPGNFADDIYVSLLVVSDQQLGTENYPYCALSYHWGDGDYNNTIFVQEDASSRSLKTLKDVVDAKQPKKFKIKPNLHEALRHLRDKDIFVSVWIDALCINQFDEEEKNEQVNKMALIYRQAYNVNVWLGSDSPENPVSDLAMSFISKVINPDLHGDLLTQDKYIKSWASLFELLKWSW
jgi:hypothetical protein